MKDTRLRPRIDYGRCRRCGLCVDICGTPGLSVSRIRATTSADGRPTAVHQNAGKGKGGAAAPPPSALPFGRYALPAAARASSIQPSNVA
ncbi:MAG: 4Fe-4S binding protein [Rhodospirillales bacterium]|nr:4Fe-4S binding protein [Rhodospirillales bacterium]